MTFRLSAAEYFGENPSLALFSITITLSAYWGGLGPGLAATLATILATAYFLLPPIHDFRVDESTSVVQLALISTAGLVISVICTKLHRARAEAERTLADLRTNEAALRAALKELSELKVALDEHAIVAVTDPSGRILSVNDKFCAISKFSRDELIGRDHRLINSGYHPKDFIQSLWRTISSGKPWHGEIRNRAKDGTYYWVDTTIVPLLDAVGKPRQYVAIRADITERKKAEQAVRASQEQLQTVVESMTEGLVLAELDGRLIHWNRAALQLHGFRDASEGQRYLGDFERVFELRDADGTFVPSARWPLSRILAGESLRNLEIWIRRVDISWERVFSYGGAIVSEPSGRRLALLTMTDTTERHQAAESIRRMNSELESRVRSRTTELELANQELEAFSYSVSHDLRSPLRAMDGFSQALLEDYGASLPAEGQAYLRTIREGAQRMGTLIDDLLRFSRLSRQPLRKGDVDMKELVERTWQDLRIPAERSIQFAVGPLGRCAGDVALLRQVWANLLSNAVKYTGGRDPAVVEVGRQCEQGGETTFYVRDNGAGFDMKYADKLFGVFQRLHRADEYEGTGVGLAITHRIIQRHGGKIWAQSEPGRGATFYFTLPGANPL